MSLFLCLFTVPVKYEFGVSLEDLLNKIGHENSRIVKDKDELEKDLLSRKENHVYMFMGAGSISAIAHEFAEKLEK